MDKKEVLEQLVKGLKQIKEDLEKKEVKEAVSDMKSAVSTMKDSVGKLPAKEPLKKELGGEVTKKVNTPAAMGALKAKAASNLAARKPEPQIPGSNEATKKIVKDYKEEKTAEESAGKTVEKIAHGSKNTSDAARNLMDEKNYPKHTQEKAKKKGLSPFLMAKKNMKKMSEPNGC